VKPLWSLFTTGEEKRRDETSSHRNNSVSMEEVKAAVAPPFPPATKKRPLDSNANSTYFKIRAAVRDLRPHLLEVQYSKSLLLFFFFIQQPLEYLML